MGTRVRRRVEDAPIAIAGPLEAHEPITAGIEAQRHCGEEAKLPDLPRFLGESFLDQLVPYRFSMRTYEYDPSSYPPCDMS
jgi:hypothetical protein